MLHWIFRIDQGVLPYGRKLLYYSYLVYCKPFNVLFRGSLAGAAKNVAKLQVLFETRKFFAIFFFNFFFGSSEALRPSPDRLRLGGTSVPKASAKLHLSSVPSKYFPEKVHQNYVFKHIFNIRLQLTKLHHLDHFRATFCKFRR